LNRNVTGNGLLNFFANDKNNTFIVPGDTNTMDVIGSARGEMTLSRTFKGVPYLRSMEFKQVHFGWILGMN
jgi:hypothetical protein